MKTAQISLAIAIAALVGVAAFCTSCDEDRKSEKLDASFKLGTPVVTFPAVFDPTIDTFTIDIPMTDAKHARELVADFLFTENGQVHTVHATDPLYSGSGKLSLTVVHGNVVDGTISTDNPKAKGVRFNVTTQADGLTVTVDGVATFVDWP